MSAEHVVPTETGARQLCDAERAAIETRRAAMSPMPQEEIDRLRECLLEVPFANVANGYALSLITRIDSDAKVIAELRSQADTDARYIASYRVDLEEARRVIAELQLTSEEADVIESLLVNDVQGRGKRMHGELIAKVRRAAKEER